MRKVAELSPRVLYVYFLICGVNTMLKKIEKISLKEYFLLLAAALVIGILGGAVGAAFHHAVDHVTHWRGEFPEIVYALPVAGLAIPFLYSKLKAAGLNTDTVIEAGQGKRKAPFALLPAIFLASVLTHFFGGSAGREGAALQIGGSLGQETAKRFRLSHTAARCAVLAGMSSLFSAMFATPIAAAVFSLEIAGVTALFPLAIVPSLVASFVAIEVSALLGVAPMAFTVPLPSLGVTTFLLLLVFAALCGLVSDVFCVALHRAAELFARHFPNSYMRVVAGGCIVVVLTILVGNQDYNGAGMGVINAALSGEADPMAFIWKIFFTAITIGCGYKGGEVVPSFFVGATFGCTMGAMLGFDPIFTAAVGMVAVFCGATNAPLASFFLCLEMFGPAGWLFYLPACFVSYFVSTRHGLYHSQQLLYPKIPPLFSYK